VGIEAMHCLGEDNATTQAALIADGHFDPIIKVLTQTRFLSVQVSTPLQVSTHLFARSRRLIHSAFHV